MPPKKTFKPSVTFTVKFDKKISRLFIFRCLWFPVIIVPCIIIGIWFGILNFVHFWYMLILGKRSEEIWLHQMHAIRYITYWNAYLKYYVNARPPVWPWNVE